MEEMDLNLYMNVWQQRMGETIALYGDKALCAPTAPRCKQHLHFTPGSRTCEVTHIRIWQNTEKQTRLRLRYLILLGRSRVILGNSWPGSTFLAVLEILGRENAEHTTEKLVLKKKRTSF